MCSAAVYISTGPEPDSVNGHIRDATNWPPELRWKFIKRRDFLGMPPQGASQTLKPQLDKPCEASSAPITENTKPTRNIPHDAAAPKPSTVLSETVTKHATPVTALDSSSSSSSPPFPSSSSTGASSYSVTQKEDQQTSTTDDVPRRNARRERQPATSRLDARSLRPLGPKHLEYWFKVATKNLSAVAQLHVWSIHFSENLSTKVPHEWMQHDDQAKYERGYKKPEAENGREIRRLRARIRWTPEVKTNDVSREKETNPSGSVDRTVELNVKCTDASLPNPSSSPAVIAELDVPSAPASQKRSCGQPKEPAPETSASVMEIDMSVMTPQSPVPASSRMKFRLERRADHLPYHP
ncbi:hypothetical protein ACEPAF_1008 [Sanghuangporus sanghuang]